jgi:hypothetical protein
VKLVSFGGAFFILPGERGVVAKEGLWMVIGREAIWIGLEWTDNGWTGFGDKSAWNI